MNSATYYLCMIFASIISIHMHFPFPLFCFLDKPDNVLNILEVNFGLILKLTMEVIKKSTENNNTMMVSISTHIYLHMTCTYTVLHSYV